MGVTRDALGTPTWCGRRAVGGQPFPRRPRDPPAPPPYGKHETSAQIFELSIRSRKGTPSRKERVVKGQITRGKQKTSAFLPPPSAPPSQGCALVTHLVWARCDWESALPKLPPEFPPALSAAPSISPLLSKRTSTLPSMMKYRPPSGASPSLSLV